MGERECFVQRRHQKVIEETPLPVDANMRRKMEEVAVSLLREVGYTNAGTVEFILDGGQTISISWKMNTRLQVQHPITELVTSLESWTFD